eukprot:CAMPEP_0184218400 /NCGR_PEP_ID=MMETSP0976-20121227/16673_1 /TAXON_ID=483370 /ORGANISM="non described non described, Strain CCMP2097" /LENGTH=73 /DNA_ID=CAMNT_0026523229 /DNA_START=251 /DNA_END=472 /DNA_ORIENTATION=+
MGSYESQNVPRGGSDEDQNATEKAAICVATSRGKNPVTRSRDMDSVTPSDTVFATQARRDTVQVTKVPATRSQ